MTLFDRLFEGNEINKSDPVAGISVKTTRRRNWYSRKAGQDPGVLYRQSDQPKGFQKWITKGRGDQRSKEELGRDLGDIAQERAKSAANSEKKAFGKVRDRFKY